MVGFQLSPLLWKKIKYGLSAGRVQSVAVRLIVDREREINQFEYSSTYKISADFKTSNNDVFNALLDKKYQTKNEVETVLESLKGVDFNVNSIHKKPKTQKPPAPFTTSSLQQEASKRLGFSVSQTMIVAQQLYEDGYITYMRTDSYHLSNDALENAKTTIINKYGADYHELRTYQTKSKGAQEAHEAVRPTDFNKEYTGSDNQQAKLYDLIMSRSLASQMAPAIYDQTVVSIINDKNDIEFIAKGETLDFPGFQVLYKNLEEEDKNILPKMTESEKLDSNEIIARERFTKHPARYNEASLVRKLEELGIGRPSTYAPTITTIQKRDYVQKKDKEASVRSINILTLLDDEIKSSNEDENYGREKNKLFPSDTGYVVNDYLVKYFENIMDFNFTASIEEDFDSIANGDMKWN